MLNWYIADYTFNCTIDFTLIFILDCTLLKRIPSRLKMFQTRWEAELRVTKINGEEEYKIAFLIILGAFAMF